MKKKIAIISPDSFTEMSYHNLTLAAKRSYQLANLLSTFDDFEVTLLSPHKKETIVSFDFKNDKILQEDYSFSAAYFSWSEELDKKLLKFDFVIIQTAVGVGFQNCTVLPKKINVIVDAWLPMSAQYPVELLNKHRIKRKFAWELFLPQYKNLLQRANCILCANEKQRSFYEGQFFMIDKLGWDAFKFSPIHKIPYIVNNDTPICKNTSLKNKIIWYGDIHQCDFLIELIKNISTTGIQLDIVYRSNDSDSQKNRYSLHNLASYLSDTINLIDACTPINFDEYSLGIYINNNWIEDTYSNNCDIFELLFRGIPVVTNNYFELHQEYPFLINNGVFFATDITTVVNYITAQESISFSNKAIKLLRSKHSSETVSLPLINYLRTF